MDELITLQNEELTVKISPLGAEVQSVCDRAGNEFLWQGTDPAVWVGHSPILFPFCGGIRGGSYTHAGRTYTPKKHGFARTMRFTPCAVGETEASFLLTDSEETRAVYPFAFRFVATFRLEGKTLSVSYTTENRSGETMYYTVGSHEAYALTEDIEEYDLIFPENEVFDTYTIEGIHFAKKTERVGEGSVLPLDRRYFATDSLGFGQLNSRSVTLASRTGSRRIRVDYAGQDLLVLWQVEGARYLCIEPWTDATDFSQSSYELAEKDGVRPLAAGATETLTHRITFEQA